MRQRHGYWHTTTSWRGRFPSWVDPPSSRLVDKRINHARSGTPGGRGIILRLISVANQQSEPKRSRDVALLWLIYGCALHLREAVDMRVPELIDSERGRIGIPQRAKNCIDWFPMPPATQRALFIWMYLRGSLPGPLFMRLDRAVAADAQSSSPSLTVDGIRCLLATLARRAHVAHWPLDLRRMAISEALVASGGDWEAVDHFARVRSRKSDQDPVMRSASDADVGRLLAP
jgi:hypothetical protein